ncbi:hypothetical protein ES705_07284 [subsurface metagenome]
MTKQIDVVVIDEDRPKVGDQLKLEGKWIVVTVIFGHVASAMPLRQTLPLILHFCPFWMAYRPRPSPAPCWRSDGLLHPENPE